jgi:hypothetical protein
MQSCFCITALTHDVKLQDRHRIYKYIYRNIEARCRGKAILHISVCVCARVHAYVYVCVCEIGRGRVLCARLVLLIQDATRRHIVIGLSGSTSFFDIIS